MYCFTPAPCEIMIDEYSGPSVPFDPNRGIADRQISWPVSLFRATIAAASVPGATSTRSPSTSGDSANIQLGVRAR